MAKIRSGFVSNSSSSSFIIGLGRVVDIEKAMKAKTEFPELEIDTLHNLTEGKWSEVVYRDGRVRLDCEYGNSREVSVIADKEKDKDSFFAKVSIHNNEGDDEEGSEFFGAVYDGGSISSDYFGGQEKYLSLNEEDHGIANYDSTYGCGRNG